MTAIPEFLSTASALVVLGLIVAGVMKLFQIANDMHELKEVVKDMRRISQGLGSSVAAPATAAAPGIAALSAALPAAPLQTESVTPANLPNRFSGPPPTPEELVRAVHAQDFRGDDFPL